MFVLAAGLSACGSKEPGPGPSASKGASTQSASATLVIPQSSECKYSLKPAPSWECARSRVYLRDTSPTGSETVTAATRQSAEFGPQTTIADGTTGDVLSPNGCTIVFNNLKGNQTSTASEFCGPGGPPSNPRV